MRSHHLPKSGKPGISVFRIRTTAGERLQTSIAGAAPWTQLTPNQRYFRDSIGTGRLGLSPAETPSKNVYHHRRHPDGTVDVVKLEPDFEARAYLDLGGKGGRDVAIGRP